jgi:hypothetical protein
VRLSWPYTLSSRQAGSPVHARPSASWRFTPSATVYGACADCFIFFCIVVTFGTVLCALFSIEDANQS